MEALEPARERRAVDAEMVGEGGRGGLGFAAIDS